MSIKSDIFKYGTGISFCWKVFHLPRKIILHFSWVGSQCIWHPEARSNIDKIMSSSRDSSLFLRAAFRSHDMYLLREEEEVHLDWLVQQLASCTAQFQWVFSRGSRLWDLYYIERAALRKVLLVSLFTFIALPISPLTTTLISAFSYMFWNLFMLISDIPLARSTIQIQTIILQCLKTHTYTHTYKDSRWWELHMYDMPLQKIYWHLRHCKLMEI